MKLQQLHEAKLASQLTGAYNIALYGGRTVPRSLKWNIGDIPKPILFKDRQVLLYNIEDGGPKQFITLKVATFGSNPYNKVRRFVSDYFDEELDDFDMSVTSLIDDKRLSIHGANPTVSSKARRSEDQKELFKEIYQHLERAEVR